MTEPQAAESKSGIETRVHPDAAIDVQPRLVEIRDLSKYYVRSDQVIPVLVDIDLLIDAGEFIALMGPSGSGKSTLLNLIAGIDKPSSGQILVGGIDIATLSDADLALWRASNVGFIFQFYNLIPVLTAFGNVELPLQLTSLSRSEASLISIGRLMPARTSAPVSAITEMARFDGVPPNMSVRTMTPPPASTRRTASISSVRRASTSSSGPMDRDSICSCGPTTCSRAARNSAAKPP
jgi:ABC-type glutathione transport system ATPase component